MFSKQTFFLLSPDKAINANLEDNDERAEGDYVQGDDEGGYENADMGDGEYEEGGASNEAQLAPNQALVTLSYSLMSQIRQTARMEGVTVEDIIIELLSEGVTRRAFQDASRPAPSHLMTRTGYVAPDANGNVAQPSMSHHSYGNQQQQRRGGPQQNNRRNNNNNNYNKNFNGNGGGGFNRYPKKNNHQNNRNNNYRNDQQGYRDNNQGGGQPVDNGSGINKDEKNKP